MKKRILDIFRIRHEERMPALISTVIFLLLNALTVIKYWEQFSVISGSYHKLFVNGFRISGFDPLTYEVLSNWWPAYNVYRHPLLAFMMYPFNQITQGLMMLTNVNFAIVVTAIILVFCSTYSFIFLYRILRNVIGISRSLTLALSAMMFGFGFIMLSCMVPDHFIMSMCCLLLTLWLSGEKLKRGSALNWWQTVALFILTAGVSLNNGLKIFMAALITRRKRFFRPLYLLLAIIIPACLMWWFARWEYRTYVLPKEMARYEIKAKKQREVMERLRAEVRDSLQQGKAINADKAMTKEDSVQVEQEVKRINKQRAIAKYRRDHKQIWNKNTGKPIMKGEFMRWTDITTSRWDTAIENLFGESIQLHSEYALGDVLRNRPVIVAYSGFWRFFNYGVEAIIVLLFIIGTWYGRRSLLMWTALSFFLFDIVLHMGLGFGINEIYIMSAHYLYAIPIAIAYIAKGRKNSRLLTALITLLAIWLWAWNATIITTYMLS